MSGVQNLSRRSVLQGFAVGGLALGAPLGGGRFFGMIADELAPPVADLAVGLFLTMDAKGTVTILASRSEMGTGIRTCLPLVAADELDADRSRIKIEQAIGDPRLGSQNTDGSKSIREFYQPMREVGATARAMLEQAAAARWGVPVQECRARNHGVEHAATKRRLDFGDLVAAAAKLPVPKKAELTFKSPADWRFVGKPAPIEDLRDMTTGAGKFGLDVTPEGCRFAAIAHSPVLGGRVGKLDASKAKARKGVIDVVELAAGKPPYGFLPLGGVAVLAENTWAALQGRDELVIEWTKSAEGHDAYDSAAYRASLEAAVRKPGKVVRNEGDVTKAFADAGATIAADYYLPHLAHAPMEPPCAVARFADGACEVWAPTQNPQAAQTAVAEALGVKPEKVTVHVTLLGGGFGRKSKPDYVAEAAVLSQKCGAPVKVVWSREDDIRHDYFHSVAAIHCEASVDAKGRPTAWLARSAFPSLMSTFNPAVKGPSDMELALGFVDLPFAIPNLRLEACDAENHVRVGWLRAVANVYHAFAICSFVDELAVAANRDPLEFTLDLLGPPRKLGLEGVKYPNYGEPLERYPIDIGRMADVLRLAADKAGWGKKLPKGRGLGLAVHRSFAAFVAVVADVEVAKDGSVTVHAVDIAVDCGLAVNPDRVRSQMEGAVIFGLSLTMHGKITAKAGQIEQSNFHDYPVLRIGEAPRTIRVHIVESTEPPGGVGEPGVPPLAPAVCAAIQRATGKRVRSLPLADHDLAW